MRSRPPIALVALLGILPSMSAVAHPCDAKTATTSTSLSTTSPPAPFSGTIDDYDPHRNDDEDGCSSRFFEFTSANINSSDVYLWYSQSREHWREKYPEEFKNYGEVRYFGHNILGLPNFSCSLSKNGCDESPTCETILRKTEIFMTKNGTSTPTREEIRSRARQIYFVVKSWENIGRYYNRLDVSRNTRLYHFYERVAKHHAANIG
jgi:hypothetical protein